jgi:SAM-dependent methyltransferase
MAGTLIVPCMSAVVAVDCTPDGRFIVAGTTSGHVSVFESSLGDPTILRKFDGEAWAVSIDAMGETLVVGTAQKRPQGGCFYWLNRAGDILFKDDLTAPVWGTSVSPSGRYAACSTWAGDIAVYERKNDNYSPIWRNPAPLGAAGVYGVTIDDHPYVTASVYERGVLVVDVSSDETGLLAMPTGLFHVSRPTAAGTVLVGRRDGDFCELSVQGVLDGNPSPVLSSRLTRRSLPGVATSRDRTLRYAAGFDGTLVALGPEGAVLWRQQFQSELWAVATSSDGSCVSVASGDGTVRVMHYEPGSSGTIELEAWAAALREGRASVDRFAHEVSRLGAFEFGFKQISELRSASSLSEHDAIQFAQVAEQADDLHIVYRAGALYHSLSRQKEAIRSFQRASLAPELYSGAMRSAATCFAELGFLEVQKTLSSRATIPIPSSHEIAIVYDLGRAYEEGGEIARARRSYEYVVGWNVTYRDAAERLGKINSQTEQQHESGHGAPASISQLLGPNVPRPAETDGKLYPVLEARTREMRSSDGTYLRRLDAVRRLQTGGAFSVYRDSALHYDVPDYRRYESAPVEDNSKKHLEAASLLAEIDLNVINRSLDIGTATCRYPILLERLGVQSYGVDLNRNGYDFHRSRGGQFSRFIQGDGRALPFAAASFDLITCMMGTLNHLAESARSLFLSECYRVLRPGGSAVFGCWDTECPFVSYLTMYSSGQLEQLRANGITQNDLVGIANANGFGQIRLVPFCFFSDRLIRDLGLESSESHDAEMLVDMDFALQGRQGATHGQMYIAICQV